MNGSPHTESRIICAVTTNREISNFDEKGSPEFTKGILIPAPPPQNAFGKLSQLNYSVI